MFRRDSSLEVLQRANQRLHEVPGEKSSSKEEDITRYLSSMRKQTNVSTSLNRLSDISDISISEEDSDKKKAPKKSFLKKRPPQKSDVAPSFSSSKIAPDQGKSASLFSENSALLKANALLSSYEKKGKVQHPTAASTTQQKESGKSEKEKRRSSPGREFHLSLSSGSEKSIKVTTPSSESHPSSSSRRNSSRSDSIDKKLYTSNWDTPLDYMNDEAIPGLGKGGKRFLKKKDPVQKKEVTKSNSQEAERKSPIDQRPMKSTLKTPRTPPSPKKRVTIDDAFYQATSSISETNSIPVVLRYIKDIEEFDDSNGDEDDVEGGNIYKNVFLDANDLEVDSEGDNDDVGSEKMRTVHQDSGSSKSSGRGERILEISEEEISYHEPDKEFTSSGQPKKSPDRSTQPLSHTETASTLTPRLKRKSLERTGSETRAAFQPKAPHRGDSIVSNTSRPVSTELEYTEDFDIPSGTVSPTPSQDVSVKTQTNSTRSSSISSESTLRQQRGASSSSSTSRSSLSSRGKRKKSRSKHHRRRSSSSSSISASSDTHGHKRGRDREKKKHRHSSSASRHRRHEIDPHFPWTENLVDLSLLKGLGMTLNYKDPAPIATSVVNQETLTALTSYNPMMIALNNLLRQQLTMSQSFLLKQRAIYQFLLSDLELGRRKDHSHYTTLEATKKYIRKHRPKSMSYKEALKEVEKEMAGNS